MFGVERFDWDGNLGVLFVRCWKLIHGFNEVVFFGWPRDAFISLCLCTVAALPHHTTTCGMSHQPVAAGTYTVHPLQHSTTSTTQPRAAQHPEPRKYSRTIYGSQFRVRPSYGAKICAYRAALRPCANQPCWVHAW